ncbi:hypothetical protein CAAN1_20S02718 [[Candida] anglica]|uniref:Uncharacterized protein n=1 Tax=[Candida] anglica TaxID=148631 RepID=A0ABP0EFJ3_9ASCO
MDAIQGYSSGEEIEKEHLDVDEPTEQPVTQPHQPASLDIYSQNFIYNTSAMHSIFAYIPWRPSISTTNTLKKLSQRIITHITKTHPESSSHYKWHFIGTPNASDSGTYSITNKHNLASFHITLGPNIRGPAYKIDMLLANIKRGVRDMKLPREIIGADGTEQARKSKLNNLLGLTSGKSDGVQGGRSDIALTMEPTLHIFRNKTTGNLFVTGVLSTAGKQGLFLRTVHEIIQDNIALLSLGQGSKMPNWHISFVVGEYKGVKVDGMKGNSGSNKQGDDLVGVLDVDITDVVKDLRIHIDKIEITHKGALRDCEEVKFPVNATRVRKRPFIEKK